MRNKYDNLLSVFGIAAKPDDIVNFGKYERGIGWNRFSTFLRKERKIPYISDHQKDIKYIKERREENKREIRERLITERLNSLEMAQNLKNPESCFIALTPEGKEEIEREVEEKMKDFNL